MFVENVIVPDELCKIYFRCPLNKCKGMCCVEGDFGAPLETKEIEDVKQHLSPLLPFLDDDAQKVISEIGVFDFDLEGKACTPLKSNGECVYMIWENGIASCVFEKAFSQNRFPWKKPISCHLYPVRIKNEGVFERLYLHRWSICHAAYQVPSQLENLLIVFLQEAFIRKYGLSWYRRLLLQCKLDPDFIMSLNS